jgi:hypothetical protein
VLIDVAEGVEYSEQMSGGLLPRVVRLQSLDFCNCLCGQPVKSLSGDLVFEGIQTVAYGEHVLIAGATIRSDHKFPYQIVEGRTKVLNRVSEDNRNGVRNGRLGDELKNDAIAIRLYLSFHVARFAVDIPLNLFSGRFESKRQANRILVSTPVLW